MGRRQRQGAALRGKHFRVWLQVRNCRPKCGSRSVSRFAAGEKINFRSFNFQVRERHALSGGEVRIPGFGAGFFHEPVVQLWRFLRFPLGFVLRQSHLLPDSFAGIRQGKIQGVRLMSPRFHPA